MKAVSISYNPYLVSTEIKVDGQVPPAGTDFVQITKGSRLLNWIDAFLNRIFQKYRNNDVSIEFCGTAQDAEDLRAAVERFNQAGHKFHIDNVHVTEIGSNPLEALKKLYEEGKRGPFAEIFQSEKMQAAFKRATAPEFEVNVVATMSSGKSTLINALLGKNIMPSKQEACTATIACIEDCDDQPQFTAVRYDAEGKLLTSKPELATRKLLTEWNEDVTTSRIDIKGNIPTVDETKDSKYVFIDTPGPNNSRNEDHKKTTFDAIKSKPLSMIIYVLNAGNFGVNDDDTLLREVAKTMNEGGRQAQDRFIFVLNKVDDFDPDDDSVGKFLANAREYLNKHGISNPLIIPVSALLAKLLRLKKYCPEELTPGNQAKLNGLVGAFKINPDLNLFEHCKGCVNQEIIHRLEAKLTNASEDDKLLIYSGLPVLEELLKDFLFRHALPAKMKDAVDSFDRVLRDYEREQNLNGILQQSDKEIKEAAEAIKNFSSSKDNLAQADKFKSEIRAIQFTFSPCTERKLNEINEEKEEILETLKRRLDRGNVSSEYEARNLCERAESDCKTFEASVESTLKKALRDECYTQMDQLREKYQAYIISVLKTAFPENDKVRELEFSVFDMPNTDEMISDNTHYETVVVGKKRVWWKLWLGTVDITEDRERIDLSPIFTEVANAVRDFTQENLRNFKKQANAGLDAAKEQLIAIMDAKQKEMNELEKAISAAGKSKAEKEARKREAEKKIAWFQEFHGKLQKILAI